MLRFWNLESYISDYTLKIIKVASICSVKIFFYEASLCCCGGDYYLFSLSLGGETAWDWFEVGSRRGDCLRLPPAPRILAFLIFFFLNRNWVAEFSNFCMPWWWLCSSEYQLGVWGRGCFFKEKIESSIPRVFWGGGLECFTTWVKDGKFLVCKSEFYAQWAKHCMTLVANFTASC